MSSENGTEKKLRAFVLCDEAHYKHEDYKNKLKNYFLMRQFPPHEVFFGEKIDWNLDRVVLPLNNIGLNGLMWAFNENKSIKIKERIFIESFLSPCEEGLHHLDYYVLRRGVAEKIEEIFEEQYKKFHVVDSPYDFRNTFWVVSSEGTTVPLKFFEQLFLENLIINKIQLLPSGVFSYENTQYFFFELGFDKEVREKTEKARYRTKHYFSHKVELCLHRVGYCRK